MASVASQCPVCSPIISYRHNAVRPEMTLLDYGRPPRSDLGALQQGFENGCQACGIIRATVTQFFQHHQVGVSMTSQTVVGVRSEPLRKSILELSVGNALLDIFMDGGLPLNTCSPEICYWDAFSSLSLGESTLPFALGQLRPPIADHSSSELDRFIEESTPPDCGMTRGVCRTL